MDNYLLILIPLAVITLIVIIAVIIRHFASSGTVFDTPERRAGKRGERTATDIIKTVLREDDLLYTNVCLSFDGRETELDNVIINKYGVFIIEVKSYIGRLNGDEDDYEWIKYRTTSAGNVYSKKVKNPIKQLKRQIYIFAHYLDYYGVRVWIDGYTFLLYSNSPVKSDYVLNSVSDIDKAIHTPKKKRLDAKTIASIKKLIE